MKPDIKNRLREVITTVIGIAFLVGAVIMVALNILEDKDIDAWATVLPICLLGWVFLWSKDSLLEGITFGMFKGKNRHNYNDHDYGNNHNYGYHNNHYNSHDNDYSSHYNKRED